MDPSITPRATYTNVKFVKALGKKFDISRPEEGAQGIIAEQKRIIRQFIPFTTTPAHSSKTYSGVFFTGENPSWILNTDKGGLKLFPSGHSVVQAFTQCSVWESKGDFMVYSDEVCRPYRYSINGLLTIHFRALVS